MHWMRLTSCLLFLFFCGCVATSQQAENDQKQAEIHYKMGVSQLQANNPSQALKELLMATQLDPQSSSIHGALAQAYQMKKAFPEAEIHYQKALEYSDNDPVYQNNLGALYLDMQLWDKAIEYFDQAASNLLFLSPHIAATGKGFAQFKNNDLEGAVLSFQRAIDMSPSYARAHFLLSEVYHAQGKAGLERRSLERAVDIAPQFVEAQYQLAVFLYKQQEPEAAARHLKKVLELAPDSDWGQKSADLLRSMGKS